MLEQQDTSEAFAFLTETLQLPLLSLQVDLFHQGQRDVDDHKVVYERLLNLAVPPDPEGKGIKLEDCLEEYFNAQVDVLRDSEVAKKSGADDRRPTPLHRNTLRLVTEDQNEASTAVTASPVDISPSLPLAEIPISQDGQSTPGPSAEQDNCATPTQTGGPSSPFALGETTKENDKDSQNPPRDRPSTRARSASVIQNVVLDNRGRSSSINSDFTMQKAMRTGSTVVKAVTIPAWQFFRLIRKLLLHASAPLYFQTNTFCSMARCC